MCKASADTSRPPARFAALVVLGALCAALGLAVHTPPEARAQAREPGELRLDAFDKSYAPNEPAKDWIFRKFSPLMGDGERFFFQFVHQGPNAHYIHLQSGRNNSFSVGREKLVSLNEWPVLEWEWKITVLPKNGDVRVKERDDQAGAVCIVLDPGIATFDSSLCYLFENDGPKDTPITSTKKDNARHLILRTAKSGDPLGQWLRERRNVLQDYKRVFGHDPQKPAYFGMMIDSNDTESSAEAFYRNLVLRKS